MLNEKIYRTISVLGASFIWGFWAYHINHGDLNSRLLSAFCQGLFSGVATSIMIDAIKFLQNRFKSALFPPVIVTATTAVAGSLVHYTIGTSEIFFTVFPAVTVALIFSMYTSFTQFKKSSREKA